MKEFSVKFRGIRGSYPVCDANKLKYGGNTSCVEIKANGHTIILDAGTGIIEAGNDMLTNHLTSGTDISNREPIETVILFSHSHMDHIQGLPFFKPLYIKSSKIHLFSSKTQGKNFQNLLSDMVFGSLFPVELSEIAAEIKFYDLQDTNAIILHSSRKEPEVVRINSEEEIIAKEDDVVITCLKSNAHPKDGVMLYKISCNGKSLVYATDKENYTGCDIRAANFSRGAQILIHDSQYTVEDYASHVSPKQGFGHSTMEMAVETAKIANVSQLILFHMDPSYDDSKLDIMQAKAQGMFPNIIIAHENLGINLMQEKCKL